MRWVRDRPVRSTRRRLPQRLRHLPGPARGRSQGRGARTHGPRRLHALHSASRLVHAEFQRDIPEARRRRDHGAQAFVDAEDIAAVAAATLASPDAHAGAEYAPTGPEALTVSDAADVIADVIGRPAKHNDTDRDAWIDGSVAAGVPAEYGERLRMLTETIASGHGSRPNSHVQSVTGVPPISFADFARRTAQAWA
jgi:nucleoside-diphosphate-sugar epimerase